MSCLGDCLEMGPPPDSILFLPPPPAPSFLLHSIPDLLLNTTPCSAAEMCESESAPNRVPIRGDYVDMPRKDVEAWSGIGDTWLFVLVASSIGVFILGALLAMFLLKCREMNFFASSDCSSHRQMKNHESRECATVSSMSGSKITHPTESVLYHGGNMHDNRMVWASLTPRGTTHHFISENYPPDLIEYGEIEDHYETIDNIGAVIPPMRMPLPSYPRTLEKSSFDNSGFSDYEYDDPVPLVESYQLDGMARENSSHLYQTIGGGGNADMRCAGLGTVRRSVHVARPMVSSPTRIENPNLPPLNMYPLHKGTLKKNATLSYRAVDGGTLPKYSL